MGSLSVVIITLNEAENLPRLLATLPTTGVELIVLDSNSTDATRDIAAKAGAVVQTRAFDQFAAQKNAAFDLATKPWILSLDADEVPSPALWKEILDIVATNDTKSAWRIPRRQVFLGRKLCFGKTTDKPLRLIARGCGSFSGAIHEEIVPKENVRVETTKNSMSHFSYKNLTDYFIRFNRYTSAVAKKHFDEGTTPPPKWFQVIRFFGEFIWRYLLRGGFLDGYQGFIYALFGSVYVFVKYAKLQELSDHKTSRQG